MPSVWTTSVEPGWSLTMDHPSEWPEGVPIVIDRGTPPGSPYERFHITGRDPDELYVELRRSPPTPVAIARKALAGAMRRQFGEVDVSPLKPRMINGLDAFECELNWSGGTRFVIFVERADATYQVVARPSALVNALITSSLRPLRTL